MTLIVGLKYERGVYVAADSISVAQSGGNYSTEPGNKLFRVGPFVFGCTTSFRMIQILRHELPDRLKLIPLGAPLQELAYVLGHECRRALVSGRWAKAENGRESGGNFLVGYRGELLQFQEDFSYCLPRDEYECVGSGAQYALGALHSTRGGAPKRRLRLALLAAAEHNAFVKPPFVYLRSGERPSSELGWLPERGPK